MDANSPRAKLAELVARHGPAGITEPGRCEKLLAEACGTGFQDEVASLATAADQGVARTLQDSASSSEPRAVLIDRLSRRLAKNTKLSPYAARWSVECWALALRIVRESDYLMITRLAQLQPLIDEARVDGQLTDHAVEQLVAKARTDGVDEAHARAHLAKYARPTPVVAEVPPGAGPPADASPAARRSRARRRLSPPSPAPVPDNLPASVTAGASAAGPTHEISPPPRTRASRRIVFITALCLIVAAVIAAAVGPSIRSAYIADREHRVYDAAHDNIDALAAYLDGCEICAFRDAARAEVNRLRAVRPPSASPDLEGVVRGASSAASLYVIVSARNPRVVSTKPGETVSVELFGIVDPLGKSSENPHVPVLRNYLDKAQRKVECFIHGEQMFQCFVGGNDLAVMALHDGIAKPGPNTLTEYKQAAR